MMLHPFISSYSGLDRGGSRFLPRNTSKLLFGDLEAFPHITGFWFWVQCFAWRWAQLYLASNAKLWFLRGDVPPVCMPGKSTPKFHCTSSCEWWSHTVAAPWPHGLTSKLPSWVWLQKGVFGTLWSRQGPAAHRDLCELCFSWSFHWDQFVFGRHYQEQHSSEDQEIRKPQHHVKVAVLWVGCTLLVLDNTAKKRSKLISIIRFPNSFKKVFGCISSIWWFACWILCIKEKMSLVIGVKTPWSCLTKRLRSLDI